jgi:hypothetical protein
MRNNFLRFIRRGDEIENDLQTSSSTELGLSITPPEQQADELVEKLGFGFIALKNNLKPTSKSAANVNPQLDADVELWLEKLIAETRLQSNLFSSTTTEVVDLTAKKSETNSAPSKKRKRSSVGSRVEKVTGQKEITRT